MAGNLLLGVLSDIHYASAAERARGDDYEFRSISNPLLRALVKRYRHHVWLRQPLNQNGLLDRFLTQADTLNFDYVIGIGDYTCDSACLGASDDAAWDSIRECMAKLRGRFGTRLRATCGDHELGKMSFFGGRGGMRMASWRRLLQEPVLDPFWRLELGQYVLLGITSSLVALPVFRPDTLPEERAAWEHLRSEHLHDIRNAFSSLKPAQRVLLFCHDPTALPFLWREEAVRAKLPQLEQTIIGHLHSHLVLRNSRILAGMPRIAFLGNTARRLSAALREGRLWRPFHVRLCPALAGIELLKDGGFLSIELDPEARAATRFRFHPLPRR